MSDDYQDRRAVQESLLTEFFKSHGEDFGPDDYHQLLDVVDIEKNKYGVWSTTDDMESGQSFLVENGKITSSLAWDSCRGRNEMRGESGLCDAVRLMWGYDDFDEDKDDDVAYDENDLAEEISDTDSELFILMFLEGKFNECETIKDAYDIFIARYNELYPDQKTG